MKIAKNSKNMKFKLKKISYYSIIVKKKQW